MIAIAVAEERLCRVHTNSAGGQWQAFFGDGDAQSIIVDAVVNCAGLGAQRLARTTEDYPPQRIPPLVLAKGNYFSFAGRPAFSRLIYPVPVPGGLGVHVTLDLAGRMRFGPDVEWIDAENYDVEPARAAAFYARIRELLAGAAGQLAGAGLRRHPAEADRAGRARGRFHHRWRSAARAWPASCTCSASNCRGSLARCRWRSRCRPICRLEPAALVGAGGRRLRCLIGGGAGRSAAGSIFVSVSWRRRSGDNPA